MPKRKNTKRENANFSNTLTLPFLNDKVKNLETEIQALKNEINQLKEANLTLSRQNSSLKAKMPELDSKLEKMNELESGFNKLIINLDHATGVKKEVVNELSVKNSDLNNTLEYAQKQLATSEIQITKQLEPIAELENNFLEQSGFEIVSEQDINDPTVSLQLPHPSPPPPTMPLSYHPGGAMQTSSK